MFILCFYSWTVNVNTMVIAKLFLDVYLDYKFWGTAVLFSTLLYEAPNWNCYLFERRIKNCFTATQKLSKRSSLKGFGVFVGNLEIWEIQVGVIHLGTTVLCPCKGQNWGPLMKEQKTSLSA